MTFTFPIDNESRVQADKPILLSQLQLAGNHRNASPESVSVSFGSFANVYSLTQMAPFTSYSVLATVGANPTLTFGATGGDNIGMLLDNVSVEPVPEPASLLLLGSGLTGLALRRRRRN